MELLIDIMNIIGVISFAAAGAMVAIDKETDIFGVLFLSVTTCFGGGILRDVMIGGGLPKFFHLLWPDVTICLLTALSVFVAAKVLKEKYVKNEETVNNINNVLDAIGLGIFASGGTEICISLGISPFASIVMGMLSAVGGGMLRDVLLRDIPFILRKRVYAVVALGGSGVYYISSVLLKDSPSRAVISTLLCLGVIFVVRMCATYFKWRLPKAIIFSEIEKKEESKTPITK
jgi:uncharacterized membrane protein YeiH